MNYLAVSFIAAVPPPRVFKYLVLSEWFNYLISAPQLDFHVDEIIYLRTDPEVAHERIKNRHRHEEMKIPS